MTNTESIIEMFNQSIPHLSIDCVIFGFHDEELKVLLTKFPKLDLWALQGGFIEKNEDIDVAAIRILKDLTSMDNIFLKQFQTFGKANRPTYDDTMAHIIKDLDYDFMDSPFLKQRFISIGYYSLVDFQKVTPSVKFFFERCEWFDINNLPPLAIDYAEMIEHALAAMRQSLDYQLIGFNLMPETLR